MADKRGKNTHQGALGGTAEIARTFMVTINNEEEVEVTWPTVWEKWTENKLLDKVRYIIWQFEEAPETKRKHVQMYIECVGPRTFGFVKKIIGCNKAHIEKRAGTQAQAKTYCSKEETRIDGPFEYGTPAIARGPGNRSDIANAVEVVKQTSVRQLAQNDPVAFVKWHKGLRELEYELRSAKAETRDRKLFVMCFFGEPGSGKTFTAFDLCRRRELSYYVLNPPANNQSIWYNGYNGQNVLIVDEANGNWIGWQVMLRMLDQYPLQVQTKGGMTWAQWDVVILTSNTHWKNWYPNYRGGMDQTALGRRIHNTIRFEKNGFKKFKYCDETDKDLEEIDVVE